MYDVEDGWLVQPGKHRGVRWIVHRDEAEDPHVGFHLMSDTTMQLVGSEHIRSVYGFRMQPSSEPMISKALCTYSMHVVDGVVRVVVPAEGDHETRDLYPGHSVVLPQGVTFTWRPVTAATVVIVSTEDQYPAV